MLFHLLILFCFMASKQEATVEVVNMKDRNYNGILKGQIAEIPASDLQEYIAAGFDPVGKSEETSGEDSGSGDNAPATSGKPDRQAIIAELTALGVEFKEVGTSTVKLEALLADAKAAA